MKSLSVTAVGATAATAAAATAPASKKQRHKPDMVAAAAAHHGTPAGDGKVANGPLHDSSKSSSTLVFFPVSSGQMSDTATTYIYVTLVLIRLCCAFAPSYIHPDEHLQGPEVIVGNVLGWQVDPPWEFRDPRPIRAILPLWLAYGVPLQSLKWVVPKADITPMLVFRALRLTFFCLSFVNGKIFGIG